MDRCLSGASFARQQYDHYYNLAKDYERMVMAPGPLNTDEMTRQNQAAADRFIADAVTQKNLAAHYDLEFESTYAPMKTWGFVCGILSAALFLLAWVLPRPAPKIA